MILAPFKLVRDYVVDQMEARGCFCLVQPTSGSTYRDMLARKVIEEANELFWARNEQDRLSELADLQEVIEAYRIAHNVRLQDLQQVRERKALKYGAFARGIKLLFAIGPKEVKPWES